MTARLAPLLCAVCLGSLAPRPRLEPQADGAPPLLAAATRAIGASDKIDSVWLAVDCDDIVNRGEGKTYSSRLDVRLVLPDHYLVTRRPATLPGMVDELGFRGTEIIRRVEAPPGMTVGPRLAPQALLDAIDERQVHRFRRDATRLLVGLLLTDRTPIPIQWQFGGRAKSANQNADILDASGPEDLAFRLFIDASTHVPLMMTFDEFEAALSSGGPGGVEAPTLPPVEKVPQALYFGDPRRVDGVLVAQTITRTMSGRTVQQWRIDKVRFNPPAIRDVFKK